MANEEQTVTVRRWSGGQHPSLSNVTRLLEAEGLRPFLWTNTPNHRYAVRSHGYSKVLYVIDGSLEVTLPDSNELVRLRTGDRIDVPARVRHGITVGLNGTRCVEANISSTRSSSDSGGSGSRARRRTERSSRSRRR